MATLVPERKQRWLAGLRPVQWTMIGVLVLALSAGGYALRGQALVTYVSIQEAKTQARPVQVFGYLYSKGSYDARGHWRFDMQGEDGDVMTVVYPQARPVNFEQAISVVAIGRYEPQAAVFTADQLLVKCPSKYQEQLAQQ